MAETSINADDTTAETRPSRKVREGIVTSNGIFWMKCGSSLLV